MPDEEITGTRQPAFIGCKRKHFVAGKVLGGVRGGTAQRFQQSTIHQDGYVHRLEASQSRDFTSSQSAGQSLEAEDLEITHGDLLKTPQENKYLMRL
jgi:hypothetical protein